jgi:hypothetical protein
MAILRFTVDHRLSRWPRAKNNFTESDVMFNIAQSAKFDLPAFVKAITASRLPTLIPAMELRRIPSTDLRSTRLPCMLEGMQGASE